MTTLREDDTITPAVPARPIERITNTELLEALGVAVYMTDANGIITDYNQAAAELWGRAPEIGKDAWCGSWRLFWPDGTPMAHGECPLAITLRENRAVRGYEAIAERPDGTFVNFVPYPTPLRDAEGKLCGAVNVLVDVTARKQAEDAAQITTDRLRRAQLAAKIGTFDWNVQTNELIWDGVEEVHGREPGSFEGTFDAYTQDIHPEDRERVVTALSEAVQTATGLDIEYRIICPDGSVRWVNGKSRVFTDADGKTVRVTGTCQDVSERRRDADEREQLLRDLTVASAAKDDFLGMVSHELRSPITAILGNAQILANRGDRVLDSQRQEAMLDILHESERLRRLIENLLALSRIGGGRPVEVEPLLLARHVEAAVARHRQTQTERAYHFTGDHDIIALADAGYIEQVLENLLGNAAKYSPSAAPIDVAVTGDDTTATVTIADGGSGLPAEECERVFEPFYRSPATADQAAGTGIGLAVCARLIEAQGGRIWAEPRDGGGTVFSFTLPAA